MTRREHNLGKIGAGLLAVALVGVPTAGARAEALLFRNDTNGAIIVQAACVVRGVLRRDRPYLLKAGDSTPGIVLPGNKLITVYDGANPNRVLFQGTVPGGPSDQAFSVAPDPLSGAIKLDLRTAPGP